MNIGTLALTIGTIALVVTLITGFIFKKHKSWVMTFLQNFCGFLFIFSGWVKAVDPLGTAYKLEQYFAEFYITFDGTWVSFLAPVFPWLANYSLAFSVLMIVFEIVLGIMLIIGARTKITSWAFLLLVVFFTILTGFTFLTGYVPSGENFFSFGQWGAYKESNMRVTDCGCFGDFIKLKPKTSFLKDIVLLVPAIYFVFKHKDMRQWFSPKIRSAIIWIATAALFLYCLKNYAWDLPGVDFRPFKVGADIAALKVAEEEAQANVSILAYEITDKETKKTIVLPFDQYLKDFKNYPSAEFELNQLLSNPSIPITKISDYEIESLAGDAMTEELLAMPGYNFMIVSYKLKGKGIDAIKMVKDTSYVYDTIRVASSNKFNVQKRIGRIDEREKEYTDYIWDKRFGYNYREKIAPLSKEAKRDGIPFYGVAGGASEDQLRDLAKDCDLDFPFYVADDILLKTIVRSNPGVVLWKDGVIIQKWHINKLPDYEEIKRKWLK
jgi:uncharacterized membrane protein YphA (DoxX/SURF4 family)